MLCACVYTTQVLDVYHPGRANVAKSELTENVAKLFKKVSGSMQSMFVLSCIAMMYRFGRYSLS